MGSEKSAYIPEAIHYMVENVMKKRNPVGLSSAACAVWAKGLDLPSQGSTLLFTGCEYQIMPYSQALVEAMKKGRGFGLSTDKLVGLTGVFKKVGLDPAKIFASLTAKHSDLYFDLVRKSAQILLKLGVEFTQILELEVYSGAILWEFGFHEEFSLYARGISNLLRDHGIKRMITISPHSGELFKTIYPQFVPGFDIEVLHYTQLVAEAITKKGLKFSLKNGGPFSFHDPCRLVREMELEAEPRAILANIEGLELKEPYRKGRWTTCCGGSAEILYPELADRMAIKRLEEIQKTGAAGAIVACPICFANLTRAVPDSKTKMKVLDLLDLIYNSMR